MSGITDEVLSIALELGAEYADVRVERRELVSLRMSNRVLESVSVGERFGLGVRVLVNGAFGFFTANKADKDALKLGIERAVKMARSSAAVRREKVALAPVKTVTDDVKGDFKVNPVAVDLEEYMELLIAGHDAAKESSKVLSNVTTMAEGVLLEKIIATSEGTKIRIVEPRVSYRVYTVASSEGRMAAIMDAKGLIKGFEAFKAFKIEELASDAAQRAEKMLDARPTPGGRFTVIIDGALTGVFIHEALGHAAEGDHVLAGESVLEGKLGEVVGSEHVTVYDDSTLEEGWGSAKYDDEGVPTRKRLLIDRGVLKGYILNRESAHKLGLEPNGGARAESYAHPPIVRMSNTYIQPGDWSFEEMLEDIKKGVYLKGSRGGQVDPAKGTFQFNAQEAFLIENGEITRPLRDVSLMGHVLETLKNIDAVGKDFTLRIGTCGKANQGVPAGVGGPHVRIVNALVGGAI